MKNMKTEYAAMPAANSKPMTPVTGCRPEEEIIRTTYKDPTANAAIGAIDREMKRMRREAGRIGRLYWRGQLSAEALGAARRRFVGIYRPMLEKALRGEWEE